MSCEKRNENAAVIPVLFPKAQNNCFIGGKKSSTAFFSLLIVDGCGLQKNIF